MRLKLVSVLNRFRCVVVGARMLFDAAGAESDEGGQLFRLKPDSNSDRLRTPLR